MELSVFSDLAVISTKRKRLNAEEINMGYGPILRFHIPPPVFIDISIEYGMNKFGNRIYFGVEKNL